MNSIESADYTAPTHILKVMTYAFTWGGDNNHIVEHGIIWDGDINRRPWNVGPLMFHVQLYNGNTVEFPSKEIRWIGCSCITGKSDIISPT